MPMQSNETATKKMVIPVMDEAVLKDAFEVLARITHFGARYPDVYQATVFAARAMKNINDLLGSVES